MFIQEMQINICIKKKRFYDRLSKKYDIHKYLTFFK